MEDMEKRILDLEASSLRQAVRDEALHGLVLVLAEKCGIKTETIEEIYKETHNHLYDKMYCRLEQHNPNLAGYLDRTLPD